MVLSARDEASYMLDTFKDWKICYNTVVAHVNAIQSRQQTLLTLATLTLTITGFSGPSMAASNVVSKYSMIFGISIVLFSMVMILVNILKFNWFTQIKEKDFEATLAKLIKYRNARNDEFKKELVLLTIGLSCYVIAVIAYLFLA